MSLIDSNDSLTTLGNSVFGTYELVKEANFINKSLFFLDRKDTTLTTDNLDSLTRAYLKDKKFNNFIELLYYTSKNWCYSKDNEPLNELKSIQNRIDLSRSTVLLTAVSYQLIFLFFLCFVIYNLKSILLAKKQPFPLWESVKHVSIRAVFIFIIVTLLCHECFKICLLSYNKRAFGYYSSYLMKQQIKSQIKNENDKTNLSTKTTE